VRRIVCVVITLAMVAACVATDDPARAGLRARLNQQARLTPEEIRRLFDLIAPAIAERKLSVREGALTRTLNDEQRTAVLGMLTDPGAVYDIGLKAEGKNVWRGLRTGATIATSELDAMQTLWIDVDSFIPRRYEFEYSSPGFGDYAYDLAFAP
jgi:hypothetical protein